MSALGSYLRVEDVVLDLQVPGQMQLFEEVGRHVKRIYGLSAEKVAAGLQRREEAGSTALGAGVAVPHARVRGLDQVRALYMRLSPPIPFEAPDGKPVTDVLVLLVPAPATTTHLEILAQAAALFSDEAFRKALHACLDPAQVKEVFGHFKRE